MTDLVYVYHDSNYNITAISQSEITDLPGFSAYLRVPADSASRLTNGKSPTDMYKLKPIEGTDIGELVENELYKGTQAVTQIPPGLTKVKAKTKMQTASIIADPHNNTLRADIIQESAYLAKFAEIPTTELYLTEKDNPYALLHTVVINVPDLVLLGNKTIRIPDMVDITAADLYIKHGAEYFTYKILK